MRQTFFKKKSKFMNKIRKSKKMKYKIYNKNSKITNP